MIATISLRKGWQSFAAGLLALALATSHAGAQGSSTLSPPPASVTPGPAIMMQPQEHTSDWNNERFERQEFREEMEKIRKEHEDLETARDKLLDSCVNASGAQATECEQQKQALHEWKDRIHERMKTLHEKIDLARKDHPESFMSIGEGAGTRPWPPASSLAAPTASSSTPPAIQLAPAMPALAPSAGPTTAPTAQPPSPIGGSPASPSSAPAASPPAP